MNESESPPSSPELAPPPTPQGGLSSDEKMWAMIGHLSALTGLLTGGVGNVVGPLIVWQVKKDTMPFATDQAKEALNFNISWLIWGLALGGVITILMLVAIGFLLLPLLAIFTIAWVVFVIVGALKANDGVAYRYPLTLRFVR